MKIITILLFALVCLSDAAEIIISELDAKKEERRDRAFENWIPVAEGQRQFDELNKEGRFPIFSERNGGKLREIFVDKPDGLAYWTWGSMTDDELIRKHQKYTSEGFVLLTIALQDGKYWATWINPSNERKIVRHLKRYGISQATINTD